MLKENYFSENDEQHEYEEIEFSENTESYMDGVSYPSQCDEQLLLATLSFKDHLLKVGGILPSS